MTNKELILQVEYLMIKLTTFSDPKPAVTDPNPETVVIDTRSRSCF